MSIKFECRKCGKKIIRDEKKIGVPVSCSLCRTVNNTPGIAMQPQVNHKQLGKLCESVKQHNQALGVFFVLFLASIVSFIILMLPKNDNVLLPLVLFIYAVYILLSISYFYLFYRTLLLRKHLGAGPIFTAFWFFFLWPVFLIVSVMSNIKLRKRLNTLKEAGIRED